MPKTHPLSMAKESSYLHIAAIETNSKTLLRLMGLGLVTGNDIEVLRNRRGDIVLGNGNSRISLGHSIANKIMVHKVIS
jgi:Fe2+ transport system protein FeoA